MRRDALHVIGTEARASRDRRETGGILLGHDARPGRCIEVTVAGDPGPRAKRQRNRFLRDRRHAEHLADIAYEQEGSVWLGEWHTHPRGPRKPSVLDMTTYERLLADRELEFTQVVSLIVTKHWWYRWDALRLWAWLIRPERVRALDIEVVDEAQDEEPHPDG